MRLLAESGITRVRQTRRILSWHEQDKYMPFMNVNWKHFVSRNVNSKSFSFEASKRIGEAIESLRPLFTTSLSSTNQKLGFGFGVF